MRKSFFVIIALFVSYLCANAQSLNNPNLLNNTGNFSYPEQELKVNTGGLFIAPIIGFDFPLQEFANNSTATFGFGVKLEVAHSVIYPFIIGGVFQYQSHEGTEELKSANFLSTFKTNITSFGGSIDVVLNKYIRSDFTIPFLTLEVKVMNIKREIAPEQFNPGFATSDNVIGFTGGLGFTLYIFDIYPTYTYAGDYSTFAIKTRFRFPIIKF
jgi:hypothetical protein